MDKQFDELSKSLAKELSRRDALKKFGFGLAAGLIASLGLSRKASADPCPYGLTFCHHVGCVDLQFDRNNCGQCGYKCHNGYTCSYGACRYVECDAYNPCGAGQKCCHGACVPTSLTCSGGM